MNKEPIYKVGDTIKIPNQEEHNGEYITKEMRGYIGVIDKVVPCELGTHQYHLSGEDDHNGWWTTEGKLILNNPPKDE